MLALLLAAQVASAFNMDCVGRAQVIEVTGPLQAKTTSDVAYSVTYRVDLETGKWCAGPCEMTFPLKSVTESYITFSAHDTSSGALIIDDETNVQRETGAYIARTRFGTVELMTVTLIKAACNRAPFTGFPAKKF